MPQAKGPNTKAANVEQVELVLGDIDSPQVFVEELNRKLAEGFTPLSVCGAHYKLMGFVTKKKRVNIS
jgi:hypothetical protein